jgi:hypothetical protein
VLTGPNAILSAIDTTPTRIGLVLYLTLVMNDVHRRTEPFYISDSCASHQVKAISAARRSA